MDNGLIDVDSWSITGFEVQARRHYFCIFIQTSLIMRRSTFKFQEDLNSSPTMDVRNFETEKDAIWSLSDSTRLLAKFDKESWRNVV